MKLNVQGHLECLQWWVASLLWAKLKFNCGITGLRKAEKMSITMLVLHRPSTSTTDENIEAVKKMISDNRRITIREVADDIGISFGSCQRIFTDVLGMKRAAAKFVSKLLRRCWRRSRFAQKGHNWWRIMGMTIKINEESKQELLAMLKSAFQKCFEDWQKRRHKCIISEEGLLWRGQDSYW